MIVGALLVGVVVGALLVGVVVGALLVGVGVLCFFVVGCGFGFCVYLTSLTSLSSSSVHGCDSVSSQ